MASRLAPHSPRRSWPRLDCPIALPAIGCSLAFALFPALSGVGFSHPPAVQPLAPAPASETHAPTPPPAASPTALLRSLLQSGRPDWTAFYRDPVPTTFPSRAQNALTLGSLYTDGLLACLAEDPQQIHNLARDLVAVAKPLGLTANPAAKDLTSQRFDRGKSLTDCADQKKWEELRQELEASQAAAESLLRKLEDPHLADLLALGNWLRADQILAAALVERRDPAAEETLCQSLRTQLPKIRRPDSEKKSADDPTWSRLQTQATELEALLGLPATVPQAPPAFDLCKCLKFLSNLLASPPKRKTAPPSPCALE